MSHFKSYIYFLLFTFYCISSSAYEIEYIRKDADEASYGVHVWGNSLQDKDKTTWPEVHRLQNKVVNLDLKNDSLVYAIIHKNGQVDLGPVTIDPKRSDKVYLIQGASKVFYEKDEATKALQKVYDLKAKWVTPDTFAWPNTLPHDFQENSHFELYHSATGDIRIVDNKVICDGKEVKGIVGSMTGGFHSDDPEFKKRWDFLETHQFKKIKFNLSEKDAQDMIKDHIVLIARDAQGNIIEQSGTQKAGVLDELFYYKGDDLGAVVKADKITIKIWSPTAKTVKVKLYKNHNSEDFTEVSLKEGEKGVWSTNLPLDYKNAYYLYDIEQFHRESGSVERVTITDPYSLSLSENSKRSQIVDLENDFLPTNWKKHNTLNHYPLKNPTDMAIYELHTRDFSMFDDTVPEEHKGTFMAFSHKETNGINHLKSLAEAGLTHIHLLPINDMASINEAKEERIEITDKMEKIDPRHPQKDKTIIEVLESLPVDSDEQQKIIAKLKDQDGFNWGYDPHHFMVPEGAYATNTNGAARTLELRSAVKNLHENGLRVIADMVFNHTYDNTVFNKIVPDYYYRLDHFGNATKDSCCFDTASEHKMMRKLIKDATVKWVKYYKLDGVRFDLMNFLTKDTLRDIRKSIDDLTLEKDGVNGKKVYLYGEGWDFGSLKWLLPSEALHQYGASSLDNGTGSFNNVFRDSIKGKGQNERELFVDDSYLTDKTQNKDQVKLSLRGTLNDWHDGIYNNPAESINYLTAHDKATLYDHLIAKAGLWAPMEKIVQMQQMGIGFISLAQGIPFFHAGVEILRSKSGDENSYNSGDWYNKLDFTYTTNNWRKGLPPAWQEENLHAWPNWKERLQKIPGPTKEQIISNLEWFKTMLKTRKSSPLFRLHTKEQVQKKVSFPGNTYNNNSQHDERLLVMKIDDLKGERLDSDNKAAYVLFNTSWNDWLHFQEDELRDKELVLADDIIDTKEERVKDLLDHSGAPSKKASFVDKKAGKISVPCMSLMVYFLK